MSRPNACANWSMRCGFNIPDLAAVDDQSLKARENVIVGIATIKTLLEEMDRQHPDAVNDTLTAIER